MREIKFRYIWQHEETGNIAIKDSAIEQIETVHPCNGMHRYNLIARLEFTGLKDKNGKEIYEGDILKMTDVVGSVFFNTATACFDFQYGFDFRYEGGDCEPLYSNIEADIEMEVIGNIYETKPELLTNNQTA